MIQYTGSITITTTGNIDDLDFLNNAVILMNNASLATIRGLKAGIAGQKVRIISVGAGHVYFAHQNTNSSAANRLINSVTSGITPIAAGAGSAEYEYDATTQRWRLVQHHQGVVIAIPYNSGDFTANGAGGAWTVTSGNLLTFGYYLKGNELSLGIIVINSNVTGASNTALQVQIPNSWTFSQINRGVFLFIDGATYNAGLFSMPVAGSVISFFQTAFGTTNWGNPLNGTYVYFNNFVYLN